MIRNVGGMKMGVEGLGDGGVDVSVLDGERVREGNIGGEVLSEREVGVKKGV